MVLHLIPHPEFAIGSFESNHGSILAIYNAYYFINLSFCKDANAIEDSSNARRQHRADRR